MKNKKHGRGKYTYSNDDEYDGEWRDGIKSGKGVYSYSNGDTYDGQWSDNKKNGMGIYYYKDSSRYEGEYKADLKHGKGVFYSPQGDAMRMDDETVKSVEEPQQGMGQRKLDPTVINQANK